MSEPRGQIIIRSVVNGYTISVTKFGGSEIGVATEYVARSWAEVFDILKEVGAPDYVWIKRANHDCHHARW